MPYHPMVHYRRSVRLRGYDYAQYGAYFVTICVCRRECLLGVVARDNVRLTTMGEIVRTEWLESEEIRPGLQVDAFIVMPNHFHGIVILPVGAHSSAPFSVEANHALGAHSRALNLGADRTSRAHSSAPLRRPPRSLGSFVAQFKAVTTRRINAARHTPGMPVWQRNYYEHIVRDEGELEAIRSYIADNPRRWAEDRENPL